MAVNNKVTLKDAVKFHGHLGPYLILGILAGELALSRIKCRKYFGLKVRVFGATEKPKSCLIDGLQLSTGATYGKGNIKKLNGRKVKIDFSQAGGDKKITLEFKESLLLKLNQTKTHRDSEILARQLYRTHPSELFNLTRDEL